jgi:hypothetical protein
MLSALGYACAAAGLPDEATRILHDLGDLARSRYVSSFEIALIHLALGDVDASFEWLDRAHDERSGWLAMEPRLAPLRHDARFKRLLERIGLTRRCITLHADRSVGPRHFRPRSTAGWRRENEQDELWARRRNSPACLMV